MKKNLSAEEIAIILQRLDTAPKIKTRVKNRIAAIIETAAAPDQTAAALKKLPLSRRQNIQKTQKAVDAAFLDVAARGRKGLGAISDLEWARLTEEANQ